MHPSVFEETRDILAKYKLLPVDVVDVGSLDVNGTYKDLFPDCQYTGVDVTSGPNVDLLMPNEFEIPLYNSTVDLVICGSCLEHCRNPHRLVEEIFRVLRPGGWALLNAPMHWREHRYPLDCFRILPDGMAAIWRRCWSWPGSTLLKPMPKRPGKTGWRSSASKTVLVSGRSHGCWTVVFQGN